MEDGFNHSFIHLMYTYLKRYFTGTILGTRDVSGNNTEEATFHGEEGTKRLS